MENQELAIVTMQGVRCYVDEHNTAWLNVEDVARGLGFTRTAASGNEVVMWSRVNKYLDEFDSVHTSAHDVKAGDYIPENIFYRLAMKASNQTAQAFQKKVADEILPSIRQNGLYINPNAPIDPRFLRRMADELERRDNQIAELSSQVARLKPDAEYCRLILKSAEALPVTVIAKDYGMSGVAFNELLHKLQIQYKVGETWVLNQLYAALGYVRSVTKLLKNGLSVTQSYWTQRGRMFLYNTLKKAGVLPLIEREAPMATLF